MENGINNIRINKDGEDLKCTDQESIKKCIVTKEHFKDKENGYYLINYKNNYDKYVAIYDSFGIDITLPDEPEPSIIINVNIDTSFNVGTENGIFGLNTNTKDEENFFDDSDIEDNTNFELQIISKKSNTYNINCRLWKNYENYIVVFCGLTESLSEDEEFSINNNINIEYNSKKVEIKFDINSLELYKIEGKLPFIYSKSQEIAITEETTKIEMSFKINSYNDEQLFLEVHKQGILTMEKCEKESNNLKCEISKNNLDVLAKVVDELELLYLDKSRGSIQLIFVGIIKINYQNINKEDVYFKVNQLMNNNIEQGTYINFETNVTNIDKIKTTTFQLQFEAGKKQIVFS